MIVPPGILLGLVADLITHAEDIQRDAQTPQTASQGVTAVATKLAYAEGLLDAATGLSKVIAQGMVYAPHAHKIREP